MGLTTSALQIGRSALLSYQSALQIAGNNIANVGNPDYTRQSAALVALPGQPGTTYSLGNGVTLGAIRRNISEAVEARLRLAVSDRASADAERSGLLRLESAINLLGDTNLGTQIESFFNAFAALQNSPDDLAARQLVITQGQRISEAVRRQRSDFLAIRDDAITEIENVVVRADAIASEIAALNVQIVAAEAGAGSPSGPLRDQRDALLRELADVLPVTVREQPSGAINVYIGSEPLVQAGTSAGLETERTTDANGFATIEVRFKSNRHLVSLSSGRLEGLAVTLDQHSTTQLLRLDQVAQAIIREVNRVHASGQGLRGFASLTGAGRVADANVALNSAAAGLAFPPRSGTFFIDVKDPTSGAVTRTQIHVDLDGIGAPDTTLGSLAADISANVPGVTATVQPDGTLRLTASGGATFTFADDTSDVLAALGLNTFFTGADSTDVAVNPLIASNPDFVASALTGLPGDGDNAGRLAGIVSKALDALGGASIAEFQNASATIQAVGSSAAGNALTASEAILSSLQAQREGVAGVNLDEETVRLITYQRGFQGAARYLTVVDEMLQTLLGLVR